MPQKQEGQLSSSIAQFLGLQPMARMQFSLRMLRQFSQISALISMALLLSACKTHRITNLTPTRQTRNEAGVYRFEVAWDSHQQSIRTNTIKPYVIVGNEAYPMKKTPVVLDRWEALVPAPADAKEIRYVYKFEYEYKSIPAVRNDSKLSSPYTMTIIDR